jgi:hypothetical protein
VLHPAMFGDWQWAVRVVQTSAVLCRALQFSAVLCSPAQVTEARPLQPRLQAPVQCSLEPCSLPHLDRFAPFGKEHK